MMLNATHRGDKKMTRKQIALRKKFGLATTTKALQNKDGVVNGPEDFIMGGVVKGWENITWSVDTRGKVIVKGGRKPSAWNRNFDAK